jgi:glycosyltransferase involved in cell wall biosynthesis
MLCDLVLEVVPESVAGASRCGPLIRPAHSGGASTGGRVSRQQRSVEASTRPARRASPGSAAPPRERGEPSTAPAVEVVIPVCNEAHVLESNVRRLHRYLNDWFPLPTRITIADNASTDETWCVAQRLAEELSDVRALHLDMKGRGRALRSAWSLSDAAVVSYMDVDLSTGLSALLPLVAPLLSGHSDVAIGSRLHRGARVVRGSKREIISRCYNLLLKGALGVRFSDAQCGFKAVRADRAHDLLPLIVDNDWFFDTELLVLAERAGLRVHEVPVDWVDDPDSRVDIISTALADVRGVLRLFRSGLAERTRHLGLMRLPVIRPKEGGAR